MGGKLMKEWRKVLGYKINIQDLYTENYNALFTQIKDDK